MKWMLIFTSICYPQINPSCQITFPNNTLFSTERSCIDYAHIIAIATDDYKFSCVEINDSKDDK